MADISFLFFRSLMVKLGLGKKCFPLWDYSLGQTCTYIENTFFLCNSKSRLSKGGSLKSRVVWRKWRETAKKIIIMEV